MSGRAALAEGFCGFCASRMRPLTEDEATVAATWANPPCGWCPTCLGWVGAYVNHPGIYVAYGPLKRPVSA